MLGELHEPYRNMPFFLQEVTEAAKLKDHIPSALFDSLFNSYCLDQEERTWRWEMP